MKNTDWLDTIEWNEQGLIPVITQEASTRDVLTLAWINREALAKTVECGEAARARNSGTRAKNPDTSRKSSISVWIATTMH